MKHAFTPCRECKALTQSHTGYCEAHQSLAGWERHQRKRTARGLPSRGDYGAAWRKLRNAVMARDGYACQVHARLGEFEGATEVDHIVPREHGGSDDISNLQAICRACHRAKTATERLRTR